MPQSEAASQCESFQIRIMFRRDRIVATILQVAARSSFLDVPYFVFLRRGVAHSYLASCPIRQASRKRRHACSWLLLNVAARACQDAPYDQPSHS